MTLVSNKSPPTMTSHATALEEVERTQCVGYAEIVHKRSIALKETPAPREKSLAQPGSCIWQLSAGLPGRSKAASLPLFQNCASPVPKGTVWRGSDTAGALVSTSDLSRQARKAKAGSLLTKVAPDQRFEAGADGDHRAEADSLAVLDRASK